MELPVKFLILTEPDPLFDNWAVLKIFGGFRKKIEEEAGKKLKKFFLSRHQMRL